MKIYTKTGDDGTTGLFGGARVQKTADRVVAYGTVDELNAVLGLARTCSLAPRVEQTLSRVQAELFTLGAELACVAGKEAKLSMDLLGPSHASYMEGIIDQCEAELTPLQTFILPGGSSAAAHLHVARTVCRRAERSILAIQDAPVRTEIVVYLNRLSDLLFVLARYENHVQGVHDTPWAPRARP